MKKIKLIFSAFASAIAVMLATAVSPVFASSSTYANIEGYHFPAEFEPQAAIWMVWPNWPGIHQQYQYAPLEAENVAIGMVRSLEKHVHVKFAVNSDTERVKIQKALTDNGIPLTNVSFHDIPYIDVGTRDWGPIYVVNDAGQKKIVHFGFNYWGLTAYAEPTETEFGIQFGYRVAAEQGLGVLDANIVSEGGDRSFNGKGTMMSILRTELQRNPGWTRDMLEAEFHRVLGVTNFVWLDRGVIEDGKVDEAAYPGPDGNLDAYALGAEHVDEIAHFADPNTILLAEVTAAEAAQNPIAAEDRRRLEADYNILKKAKDQDGKPFRIIRMPSAQLLYKQTSPSDLLYQWMKTMTYEDGSTFPSPPQPAYFIAATSYMNMIISNGVVVAPAYWHPGMSEIVKQKDAQAVAVLKQAFPGREIVTVDPLAYNLNSGGGMHCSFQQEPATN